MEYILKADEMKSFDNNTIENIGILSAVLMERAALAVLMELKERNIDTSKTLIVCGSGNNGGDGFALARLLFLEGNNVEVVFVGSYEKMTAEARRQYDILKHYPVYIHDNFYNDEYNVIIDALFGIGISRKLEGIYEQTVIKMNEMSGFKAAIDIPSGINADNGKIMGVAFKSDLTIAIANKKIGHVLFPGKSYCGRVVVKDIGVYPYESLMAEEKLYFSYQKEDLKLLPQRKDDSNKGTFGRVLTIAGCKNMAGAATMAAKAAYKSGCGLVEVCTQEENRIIIQTLIPEAVLSTYEKNSSFDSFLEKNLSPCIEKADCINIGSGLGTDEYAAKLLEYVLKNADKPLVIDADALNIIAKNPQILKSRKSSFIIITPHLKEMSRLTGKSVEEIKASLIDTASDYAKEMQVICILKDSATIVADFDKKVYINQSGNNAMATGGSGDVLSGVVSALVSQKMNIFNASCMAVYVHGLAGDYASKKYGQYSVMAADICDCLSDVLKI